MQNKAGTFPAWPDNKGKRRCIKTQSGEIRHFLIEGEIRRQQHNARHKLIVLQRMRHEEEDLIEYRFGYYMIGAKPRFKGRWVWGQSCLLVPETDLKRILKKANKRGWFRK